MPPKDVQNKKIGPCPQTSFLRIEIKDVFAVLQCAASIWEYCVSKRNFIFILATNCVVTAGPTWKIGQTCLQRMFKTKNWPLPANKPFKN